MPRRICPDEAREADAGFSLRFIQLTMVRTIVAFPASLCNS